MDDAIRRELDELLSSLIDGSISDEKQNRLGQLLQHYPEAQDLYLAYFDIHTELCLTGGLSDVTQDPPPEPSVPSPPATPPLSGWPVWWPLTGFAIILVLLVAAWSIWPSSSAPPEPSIARLVSTEEARWADGSALAGDDGQLFAGKLSLAGGMARIRMHSGAELVMQGPMAIELLDAKAIRVEQGNLTARIPDDAVGFRVLTPTADLVDMGTEFGVAVEESGATEVHVFHGVVVARSAASGGVVPIVDREAGRIDVPRDRRDVTYGEFISVKLDRSRFRGLSASDDRSVAQARDRDAGETIRRLPPGARVVFLGDRATSRETHLLLINQALCDLPAEVAPRLFNSAYAFLLSFEEEDFQEYIDSFEPTHAVIEFGPEIAGYSEPRSPEDFRQAVTRLVDRLEQSAIEPIIATGFAIPQNNPRAQELLDSYNDFLRELASQRGYRLADVDVNSRRHPANEPELVNSYFTPTFEGFRVMAATLLDAFGYAGVTVPESLSISLMPGVPADWKMRLRPEDDRLDAAKVASLRIDESWTPLKLPQRDTLSQRLPHPGKSFIYQDRARGFATHLTQRQRQVVQAVSYVESETDREVCFNTGATLITIWLNGEKIYDRGDRWTGWHPGKERIPATLRAGRNQIVIESRNAFFLSITNQRNWPLPRPSTTPNDQGESS